MTAFIGKKTSFGAKVGTRNPKLQLAQKDGIIEEFRRIPAHSAALVNLA